MNKETKDYLTGVLCIIIFFIVIGIIAITYVNKTNEIQCQKLSNNGYKTKLAESGQITRCLIQVENNDGLRVWKDLDYDFAEDFIIENYGVKK